MAKLINTTLDDIFSATPMGSVDNAIGNVFYGVNHRQTPSSIPINKDTFGLTFFTRPQLNMSTPNIRSDRRFIPLLNKQAESVQRIIRCYLDPRLNSSNEFPCPFVDHKSAFIPLLTNHLLSASGWPDIMIDTFTSKPGAYKEVYSHVDSTAAIYSAYDITATFRNMISDPITSLFYVWTLYETLVNEGIFVPYPDFLVKNEVDYNTRIYRLVLDPTRKFVQKIACTGASYPVSVPLGASFNYESDKPLNLSNNEISITFKCMGARYQDDIIVSDFNKVVGIFNPTMKTVSLRATMKKVDANLLYLFNNRGYPRINPDTYELEWYVSQEVYSIVSVAYTRHLKAIS